MADFKNIQDFKKSKTSKYPYQDPTFLSFVLLFDFNNKNISPLLSDTAEEYLKKKITSDPNNTYFAEKLEALQNFKKALKTINNEMPWYWQSLGGVDRLLKPNPSNAYWGGDEGRLTISTLESINLAVAGLMHLYRKATFDEEKWVWTMPANLRKFRMFVYVTEIRTIRNMSKPKLSLLGQDDEGNNKFKPSLKIKNDNAGISGRENRPYFMFELTSCEFDMSSGAAPFAELSKNPEAASNEIVLRYSKLRKVEARVLNGIVESQFNKDKISPAPDSESEEFNTLADFAKSKINQKIQDIKDGVVDNLERFSREKQAELIQQARNLTVNRIQNPVNIFQNFIEGVDGSSTPAQQTADIGKAIGDNVFNAVNVDGTTIADALQSAATNALGNVYDG